MCKSDKLVLSNESDGLYFYIFKGKITFYEINWRNRRKSDQLFFPEYIVLEKIICKKTQRKMCTFDELFPHNYIVLGGIIFSEINLRKKCKSDELYPPKYIVFGRNYMQ